MTDREPLDRDEIALALRAASPEAMAKFLALVTRIDRLERTYCPPRQETTHD